jgi:hypothetical protein
MVVVAVRVHHQDNVVIWIIVQALSTAIKSVLSENVDKIFTWHAYVPRKEQFLDFLLLFAAFNSVVKELGHKSAVQ